MIDKCIEEDDEEGLDEAIKYKELKFDNLSHMELDLMRYGGFSYRDVETLRVAERNRYYDIINKKLEAMSKK